MKITDADMQNPVVVARALQKLAGQMQQVRSAINDFVIPEINRLSDSVFKALHDGLLSDPGMRMSTNHHTKLAVDQFSYKIDNIAHVAPAGEITLEDSEAGWAAILHFAIIAIDINADGDYSFEYPALKHPPRVGVKPSKRREAIASLPNVETGKLRLGYLDIFNEEGTMGGNYIFKPTISPLIVANEINTEFVSFWNQEPHTPAEQPFVGGEALEP